MRISRFSRRFHDPWGNKNGNAHGVISYQYKVSYNAISGDMRGVGDYKSKVDRPTMYEATDGRFVRATMRSAERLRR